MLRPSSMAATMVAKLLSINIRSATSRETSQPRSPIATPRLERFSAGASFTPSPVIATISLFCLSASTNRSLCSGATLLRSTVRFGRHAHYRYARSPKNLLRRRSEENLFDPALMPPANSHHDQTEMEIGRDAQNLRERVADHYHCFNADV